MRRIIYPILLGILAFVLCTAFALALAMFLQGCSDARQQQKGWDKFVKNGGKIEPITKTITVTDTIKGADGKDSIIYRTIECVCPEPVILTRWQTRYIYKTYRDSLKHERIKFKQESRNDHRTAKIDLKRTKEDNKHTIKQAKIEKRHGWVNVLIVAIVLSLLIWWLLRNNKLKRYDSI